MMIRKNNVESTGNHYRSLSIAAGTAGCTCPECSGEKEVEKIIRNLSLQGPEFISDDYIERTYGLKVLKKLKYYCNTLYRYTRKYVLDTILQSPKDFRNLLTKGMFLKEDFIEQYYLSRLNSEFDLPPYDFSQVPSIIANKKEKVDIFVDFISPKTGEQVGWWKVSFKDLVIGLVDNGVISGVRAKRFFALTLEDFIKRSEELFPGAVSFENTNYVNLKTPVTLHCNKCDTDFTQVPSEHLYSTCGYCPSCAMKLCGQERSKGNEGFIEQIVSIYGPDYWDFSTLDYVNNRTPVTLIRKRDNVVFSRIPHNFLEKVPTNLGSSGEQMISDWLTKNSILTFKKNFYIKDINSGNTRGALIDFKIDYNGHSFYIEFDGIQHYFYQNGSFFHRTLERYHNQRKRDDSVTEYMTKNGLIFIRIPYIYDTKEKVYKILDEIILNYNLSYLSEIKQISPEDIN